MKLSFGKRLLLIVHWLFSLAGLALIVLHLLWPRLLEACAAFFTSLLGRNIAVFCGFMLLGIWLLLGLGVLYAVFAGTGRHGDKNFIIVDSSESGRTRIAVGAVDQMIRQAVRGVEGITDMKAVIDNNGDTIAINCNVGVMAGVHVPTVTMNIQRAISSYIELNCGVAVSAVSVSVHSMEDADARGRKKGKGAASAAPAAVAPVVTMAAAYPQEKKEEAVEIPVRAEAAAEQAQAGEELPEIKPITLTLEVPEMEEDAEAPKSGE